MSPRNTAYEKEKGIAIITIDRVNVLNALNEETISEIISDIEHAGKDEDVRIVIITGAGDRAFSVGADVNDMKDMKPQRALKFSQIGQEMCNKIEKLEKPVIAAINGYALGGGLELAMACDLRVASENAKLGQTEINLGLVPGWGGTQRLPRFTGKMIAKEMIFTGKLIDAKKAERLGLVNIVVPFNQLKSTTKKLAIEIAGKSPIALKLVKALLNTSLETDLATGIALESEAFVVATSTEDFKEGISAFLEKREPKFKGK